ncbi:MAG: formyltetrahydrofolate deformylase [Deltaproteobacteria bacterium]|nr:formyltetrahydrofolate deformylase [Deltaproteobacteria bacterium]
MDPTLGNSTTATLLVSCDDQPGLVATLSQLLFALGLNILDADQHTDSSAGKFFQRIRFDLCRPDSTPNATRDRGAEFDQGILEGAIREVAERYRMDWDLRLDRNVEKVAIFVSKTDHCLYDLLLRHQSGELVCDIPLIVSNHPDLEPIAKHFDIDFHVFPIRKENKPEQEAREIELLREHDIDLVVMARYMQILSQQMIDAFPMRIINIHHSFLPAFQGGRPYHQAYGRGVKRIGATAHYATLDLDEGPIIEQDVVRVSHRDTPRDLARKGRDVERTVLSRAVGWHLDGRVLVYDNKTVVFD